MSWGSFWSHLTGLDNILRENWWSLRQLFIFRLWSYRNVAQLDIAQLDVQTVTLCKSDVTLSLSLSLSYTWYCATFNPNNRNTRESCIYFIHIFSLYITGTRKPLSSSVNEANSSANQSPRAAQVGFFCLCVCTLQIHTTYNNSLFISCINFTKSLPIDINIINVILKKSNRTKHIQQNCGESELHQDTESLWSDPTDPVFTQAVSR